MQMQQQFSEEILIRIGETMVTLLREHTSDITRAIVDLPAEDYKKGVKIGINIKLSPIGDVILPSIKLKFKTGKDVADSAIVELKQEKIPGM